MKNKYMPSVLIFISIFVLMVFCMICRFCGIGYFANVYTVYAINIILQNIINFLLKLIELCAILMILSKRKWYINILIGLIWSCIYWIPMTGTIEFILDCVYILIVPLMVNNFRAETLTYSIIIFVLLTAYQFLILQSRYSIDITLKFNYMAGIVSVLDYKLFVINLYFIRRFINMESNKEIPAAEERNYGGHCLLFFGPNKLKKVAMVTGYIIGFPIFMIVFGCKYTVKAIIDVCKNPK